MKKSRNIRNLKILGVLSILGVLFYIFQLDAYIWLCNNEQNSSACFLAGKKLDERDNRVNAQEYYKKACDLKYQLGCKELEKSH